MRYIIRVDIVGFQSHADTTLRFGPGVNAITGPSDNGKTAILRALKWCLWNEAPEGDWVRKGCTLAQVKTTLSDGTSILRERDKKRNKYVIEVPGKETLTLVDFGTDVPQEVLEAHGMRPVQFSAKTETILNYASQLEAPFFLTATAPERARILGRLAGVHFIDYAKRDANKDALSLAKEIKRVEDDSAKVETELSFYADLDAQKARVAEAAEILRMLETITTRLEALRRLTAQLTQVKVAMAEAQAILNRTERVSDAFTRLAEAEKAQSRRQAIQRVKERHDGTAKSLAETRTLLQLYAHQPEASEAIRMAESHHTRLQAISRLKDAHDRVTAAKAQATAVLTATKTADKALACLTEAEASRTRREGIAKTKASLMQARELWKTHRQIAKTAAVQESAIPLLEAAAKARDHLNNLRTLHNRFCTAQARLTIQRSSTAEIDATLETTVQEYSDLLQELGVCPTCLQPIATHTAAEIAAAMKGEVHVAG